MAGYSSPGEDGFALSLVEWLRKRRSEVDFPYHPRKPEAADFARRKLLVDLLACSSLFKDQVERARLVCDINVQLETPRGRRRKLDLILGPPEDASLQLASSEGPLRKAKVALPIMSLETKFCMTEHRKANSRLVDELISSMDVVRAANKEAICVAIVVVNVADRFTSPTNLPGPNMHDRPVEIRRLVDRVLQRVPIGPLGYAALAVSLIDTDNETRFELGSGIHVPAERSYDALLGTVADRLAATIS